MILGLQSVALVIGGGVAVTLVAVRLVRRFRALGDHRVILAPTWGGLGFAGPDAPQGKPMSTNSREGSAP